MISLCVPYYDDPHRLYSILTNECLGMFDEINIVDDGSPDFPALPLVEQTLPDIDPTFRDKINVYQIKEDYGFNAHGARNLGAMVTKSDWILFLDVDLELTEVFCQELLHLVLTLPDYHFALCNLFGGDPGNIFCVRKKEFLEAGGYDEELRGYHMGDKLFRSRLDVVSCPILMYAILPCNRMGRKIYEDDGITGTMYPDDHSVVQRKQVHIQDQIDMIEKRNERPELWSSIPKLQFEWEKVI